MCFNRFGVEPIDGFVIMHFGLLAKSGILYDAYSCGISIHDLMENRDRVLNYLNKIGGQPSQPAEKSEKWLPSKEMKSIDMARFISMTATEESAEVALLNFAVAGIMHSKGSAPVEVSVDPVALLSCNVALQKYMIEQLFLVKHA